MTNITTIRSQEQLAEHLNLKKAAAVITSADVRINHNAYFISSKDGSYKAVSYEGKDYYNSFGLIGIIARQEQQVRIAKAVEEEEEQETLIQPEN